jgi:hypothetical protein
LVGPENHDTPLRITQPQIVAEKDLVQHIAAAQQNIFGLVDAELAYDLLQHRFL